MKTVIALGKKTLARLTTTKPPLWLTYCCCCCCCCCAVSVRCLAPRPDVNFSIINTSGTCQVRSNGEVELKLLVRLTFIIIHQTHYEKSDWSRAFNQFTIACELDMINVISAAVITFMMSSSTSAWLLSPLECSPQKQNG